MSDTVFHNSLFLTTCKSSSEKIWPSEIFCYINVKISCAVKAAFQHFETYYTLAVKFDQRLLEQMVSLVETHAHRELPYVL